MNPEPARGRPSDAERVESLESASDPALDRLVIDLDALYCKGEAPGWVADSLDRAARETAKKTRSVVSPPTLTQPRGLSGGAGLSRRVSALAAVLAMCLVLGAFAAWMEQMRGGRVSVQSVSPTATLVGPDTPQPAPAVPVVLTTPTSEPRPQPSASPTAAKPPTSTAASVSGPLASTTVQASVTALRESSSVTTAAFLDASRGWIALGAVVRGTGDGGVNWADLATLPAEINYLDFTSSEQGWAATADGLYATQDAGRTWRKTELGGTTVATSEVDFVDAKNGWVSRSTIAGQEQFPDELLRTTDGGQSWRVLDSPCTGKQDVGHFSFVRASAGWIACAGEPYSGYLQDKWLYRTTDGGQTWTLVSQGVAREPAPTTPDSLPIEGNLAGLGFLDDSHGWLALAKGGIYRTSDGGRTWSALPLEGPGDWFARQVVFVSRDVGFVVADFGGISLLKTVDSGTTWEQIVEALSSFAAIGFGDSQHGLAAGRSLSGNPILATDDGGRSWHQVGDLGPLQVMVLDSVDPQHAWALVADPRISTFRTMLYGTADGGRTWQQLVAFTDQRQNPAYLSFVNTTTGYVGGTTGYLAMTRDGGRTFAAIGKADTQAVDAVDFVSATSGWRLVRGTVEATGDGGISWTAIPLGYSVVDLRLASDSAGWAVASETGGDPSEAHLLGTTDGGKTWTHYDLGQVVPAKVLLADERNVLLESLESGLYVSSDGGQTWTQIR